MDQYTFANVHSNEYCVKGPKVFSAAAMGAKEEASPLKQLLSPSAISTWHDGVNYCGHGHGCCLCKANQH